MKLREFDFELPSRYIAQKPVRPRDHSRLMILCGGDGVIIHDYFYNLCAYLRQGDLLVNNNTKVMKSRVHAVKKNTGAKIEMLFLRRIACGLWESLARPVKRLQKGVHLSFEDCGITAVVDDVRSGKVVVRFPKDRCVRTLFSSCGRIPLPPYIKREAESADERWYQTVYARSAGAVASPTAGLHFTPGLMNRLARNGVGINSLTLHVGWGTFRPIRDEDVTRHRMESEHYQIPAGTLRRIMKTKQPGGRVIAVGTTVMRALESWAGRIDTGPAASGWTNLFIRPGYKFRVAEGLITNFHLPRSTLIILASAFAGTDLLRTAYKEAIQEGYRFYSYGDAMMILPGVSKAGLTRATEVKRTQRVKGG